MGGEKKKYRNPLEKGEKEFFFLENCGAWSQRGQGFFWRGGKRCFFSPPWGEQDVSREERKRITIKRRGKSIRIITGFLSDRKREGENARLTVPAEGKRTLSLDFGEGPRTERERSGDILVGKGGRGGEGYAMGV